MVSEEFDRGDKRPSPGVMAFYTLGLAGFGAFIHDLGKYGFGDLAVVMLLWGVLWIAAGEGLRRWGACPVTSARAETVTSVLRRDHRESYSLYRCWSAGTSQSKSLEYGQLRRPLSASWPSRSVSITSSKSCEVIPMTDAESSRELTRAQQGGFFSAPGGLTGLTFIGTVFAVLFLALYIGVMSAKRRLMRHV